MGESEVHTAVGFLLHSREFGIVSPPPAVGPNMCVSCKASPPMARDTQHVWRAVTQTGLSCSPTCSSDFSSSNATSSTPGA